MTSGITWFAFKVLASLVAVLKPLDNGDESENGAEALSWIFVIIVMFFVLFLWGLFQALIWGVTVNCGVQMLKARMKTYDLGNQEAQELGMLALKEDV